MNSESKQINKVIHDCARNLLELREACNENSPVEQTISNELWKVGSQLLVVERVASVLRSHTLSQEQIFFLCELSNRDSDFGLAAVEAIIQHYDLPAQADGKLRDSLARGNLWRGGMIGGQQYLRQTLEVVPYDGYVTASINYRDRCIAVSFSPTRHSRRKDTVNEPITIRPPHNALRASTQKQTSVSLNITIEALGISFDRIHRSISFLPLKQTESVLFHIEDIEFQDKKVERDIPVWIEIFHPGLNIQIQTLKIPLKVKKIQSA